MGIIYEVNGLDGWSFEARPGYTKITPPRGGVIYSDGKKTVQIELDNEDLLLLQHVIGEAVGKMRPSTPKTEADDD